MGMIKDVLNNCNYAPADEGLMPNGSCMKVRTCKLFFGPHSDVRPWPVSLVSNQIKQAKHGIALYQLQC